MAGPRAELLFALHGVPAALAFRVSHKAESPCPAPSVCCFREAGGQLIRQMDGGSVFFQFLFADAFVQVVI